MRAFNFLKEYMAGLSSQEQKDIYLGYRLREGKGENEINQLAAEARISVPNELKVFYQFSYGALLGEYGVMTISEIVELLAEMRQTYEEDWKEFILPFAYVRGVGDVVAFDLSQSDEDGLLFILDGFHELPPAQWKGVCYGLKKWLLKMTKNHFHPFW